MFLKQSDKLTSVVIAGAGGFGLEMLDYLNDCHEQGGPPVAGFIDDGATNTPAESGVPLLGPIRSFKPGQGQGIVVAIGSTNARHAVLSYLWAEGINTPSFVSRFAIISQTARFGTGVIVCPYSIINRNAQLQDGVLVNVHCSVGHGASVGSSSILSPYSALNGDANIGECCFLGTRATIYPSISVGSYSIVDSHTGVRTDAKKRHMISSRGTYKVHMIRAIPKKY